MNEGIEEEAIEEEEVVEEDEKEFYLEGETGGISKLNLKQEDSKLDQKFLDGLNLDGLKKEEQMIEVEEQKEESEGSYEDFDENEEAKEKEQTEMKNIAKHSLKKQVKFKKDFVSRRKPREKSFKDDGF